MAKIKAESYDEYEKVQQLKEDCDRIAAKVLRQLGRPPGFVSIEVKLIKENTYRVNVFVDNSTNADILKIHNRRIAHSYFINEYAPNLDLYSDPPLEKLY